MKKLAVLAALALSLAGPALAQGQNTPDDSSARGGNAEENDKPVSNSAGGGK